MPRQAKLANHLSSAQLKHRYRKNTNPIESRRWHLLWKISMGWTIKNSALAVGLSYGYAKKIVKNYNNQGEKGVIIHTKSPHKRGSQPLLNELQLAKLTTLLKSKPCDGGIWSGPKVARWIERETGQKKVWNQRGWEYLKKCNYSWQKPRPKHYKGDPVEQKQWKENFPHKVKALQEKYPHAEVEVYFFDEHRVGLKPILRKVWSPVGTRPIAVVEHRYEWLYVYGFVNPKSGETSWYLIPRVNTNWLNVVLETFAVEVGASEEKVILLVMDNAGWHRSQRLECPPSIEIEFLPPYSPELQPAERLWCLVDEPLINEHFPTIEDLEDVLSQRCCILNEMTEEIKNLTNYHWLKIS